MGKMSKLKGDFVEMYQVGSIAVLKDDDPVFEDYPSAVEYAIGKSIDDSVYGIWDKSQHDDLVALVFGCEEFIK